MASGSEKNPQHHTRKVKERLKETVTHLRQDIDKVDAFEDYEKKNEAAWRKSA